MMSAISRCERSDLPQSPLMMPSFLASGTHSPPHT